MPDIPLHTLPDNLQHHLLSASVGLRHARRAWREIRRAKDPDTVVSNRTGQWLGHGAFFDDSGLGWPVPAALGRQLNALLAWGGRHDRTDDPLARANHSAEPEVSHASR
jgi:hypothetical protein